MPGDALILAQLLLHNALCCNTSMVQACSMKGGVVSVLSQCAALCLITWNPLGIVSTHASPSCQHVLHSPPNATALSEVKAITVPVMQYKRTSMVAIVAWPMCRAPVMLGGGSTIANELLPLLAEAGYGLVPTSCTVLGRGVPKRLWVPSHHEYQSASTAAGSNDGAIGPTGRRGEEREVWQTWHHISSALCLCTFGCWQ